MQNRERNTTQELLEWLFNDDLPSSLGDDVRRWFFNPSNRTRKDEVLSRIWDRYVVENPRYDHRMYLRYMELCRMIGVEPVEEPRPRVRRPEGTTRLARIAIAATIIIAVGAWGGIALYQNDQARRQNTEVAETVIDNTNGMARRIILKCGSQILLAANSRLTYLKGSADRRVVKLEGEAMFNVAHDDDRPFIVNTNALTVTVHGTEFLVADSDQDTHARVHLYNGRVSLESDGRKLDLDPGSTFALHKASGTWSVTETRARKPQWAHNHDTAIERLTFEQLTSCLKECFGLTVLNTRAELAGQEYYFTIPEDMTANQAMDIFCLLNDGINYHIEADTIIIH